MTKTAIFAILFLTAAFLVAITNAYALDFSQPVKTLDGDIQQVCVRVDTANPNKCAEEKPLTIGRAVATVLLTRDEKDKTTDVVEIARRGELAKKLYDGKTPVDLAAEDIVLIKGLLGKSTYNPYVIQQILSAIEPTKSTPVKTEDVKP